MEITESSIEFQAEKQRLQGFLARPNTEKIFPGVLVIHEIFGLTENIKDITRRLANEGYAALAVDLFSGRSRPLCILKLTASFISGSVDHFGTRDLKGALDYFSELPFVDHHRLGAIGFCLGGNFAIALALRDKRMKTIAPFYSFNPRPPEQLKQLCPVVGSFPEKDWTAKAGKQLDQKLEEYGIDHDIKIYPGAKHSFMNDRARSHHPEAAADAWKRTLEFFGRHLEKKAQ